MTISGSNLDPKEIKSAKGDNLSLEDIVHLTNKVGLEFVDAKKNSERLDLLKPTKRAKAMMKYDDGSNSEARIRRLAESDDEYVSFIEELAAAKSEAERLKLRYEAYKNLFEARRSMLSYQKAEMKIL